jgi:hypothetical protein
MERKRKLKIEITEAEFQMIKGYKGDSSYGGFIGFLIKNFNIENVFNQDNLIARPKAEQENEFTDSVSRTLNRLIERVSKSPIKAPATSITESVGEVALNEKDYQIQVRLQGEIAAWIDPSLFELGVHNVNYGA